MEDHDTPNKVEEPFSEYGSYTYANYLTWQVDEMVELIRGKVFRQAAAPRVIHQRVAGNVFVALSTRDKPSQSSIRYSRINSPGRL